MKTLNLFLICLWTVIEEDEVKSFSSDDVKQGWEWFSQGFLGPPLLFPHLKVKPLRTLGRRLWLAQGSLLWKQLESINATQFVQEARGDPSKAHREKPQYRNSQTPDSISRRTFPAMKIISWLMNESHVLTLKRAINLLRTWHLRALT